MPALTLCSVMAANAQTQWENPGGELVQLLPDGVKAVIGDERRPQKLKNLEVAGSKEKGYLAYFAATDEQHGEELWVTDGTPNGTRLVKDINPGAGSSEVGYITRFNDKVVFAAKDNEDNGIELWISDGTEGGTHLIKNIHEFESSNPTAFTQVNENQFIFAASDFDSQNTGKGQQWLYVSDGTEDGTKLICQCDVKYPGQDSSSEMASPFVRVGRRVFFKADNIDGTTGEELWVTDGTAEGTKFVKDINTEPLKDDAGNVISTAGAQLNHMANYYNEKLFFKAYTLEYGTEPWASDGTSEGTYLIHDGDPTKDDQGKPRGTMSMVGKAPYKGNIMFRWRTDLTAGELGYTNCERENWGIYDINKHEPSVDNWSVPDPGVEFDGVYVFCANSGKLAEDPNHKGGELHYWDGEKVVMPHDVAPGLANHWVKELTVCSGSAYWWNESKELQEQAGKLFRIDYKDEYPVRVTNLFADGDGVNTLRNLGGDLLFTSTVDNKLYKYHYRKANFDPAKETDNLEPEYRTRKEIAGGVGEIYTHNDELRIYPNPAADVVNVALDSEVKEIHVYDISGRLVLSSENSGKTVDVSSLARGIYKLVAVSQDGIHSGSLIKE